ncbi:uncharacterized protein N7483_010659 [Penicillium malachiteum]|uniref:uncharacterized protein n=1 Tax=Penicillium malachiteum TaxID=1324776 RepID=UPI002546E4CE|nr:uncharacterized protein N7483_010659 [Penicillium malachiteum]KAJ5713478.1 hypothetical protein N7483_010659 [Penicillium malachiteum]
MSWSQVSENRWKRPGNGLEGFFHVMESTSSSHCEGRQHFTIFSRLKIDIQSLATDLEVQDKLRYAWKQLRYEQPQIAVTTEGFDKIYEVPDEAGIESWLDRTFIVSDVIDGDVIGNEGATIKQATLYYLPEASQLVLRAAHSIIDGVGTILLWDSYLTALFNPNPNLKFGSGEECLRLPPSLDVALGHPETLPEETVAKGMELFGEAVSLMPGVGPVNKVGTVPSGPSQRRESEYSKKTTKAIVEACKQNGYSVTAAIHAAFVLTIVKHADPAQLSDPKSSKYVTVNSFNLRSHLPESYSQFAAAVYYTTWPLIVDRPDKFKFEELVRLIDEKYKTSFNDNPENIALCGAVNNALCDIVKTPEFWAAPPSRDALVSSLGIVERYLQQSYTPADEASPDNKNGITKVTVEDFKFGTETILGQSMLFLYTFRDRLRVVFGFNEAYEDESHVQTYLEDMQSILLEGLQVVA